MRTKRTICGILVVLLLASSAQAQKGDWRAVQYLAPCTRISVRLGLRTICLFERATDDELDCELEHPPTLFRSNQITFERKKIREVRLELSGDTDAMLGGLVGAGGGAALGSIKDGGTALLLAGMGAIAGGLFGRSFPIFHRKVIYRR